MQMIGTDDAEDFYNQVFSVLKRYDNDRVNVLLETVRVTVLLGIGGIFFTSLAFLFWQVLPDFVRFVFFGLGFFLSLSTFFVYPSNQKVFAKKIKRKIFNKLLKPYELSYTIGMPIDIDYVDAGITSEEIRAVNYDDVIYGEYKDVPLNIAEISLECVNPFIKNSYYTAASGIVIQIQFNKDIIGKTFVCTKGSHLNIANFGLKKVKLEDDSFNKKFEVYSDSEIEARYLLTTAFIDRLNQLQFSFRVNKILFAFVNQQLIILLENSWGGNDDNKGFF